MRNQRYFTLLFILVFTLNFFISSVVVNSTDAEISQQLQNKSIDLVSTSEEIHNMALQNLLIYALYWFVTSWGLTSIHQISQRNQLNFAQAATHSLKRLLGVMVLYLFSLIVMAVGALGLYFAIAQHNAPSLSALMLAIIGIFIFVRLCLVPTHYLLQNEGLFRSIKSVWLAAHKKGFTLLIFCLLINLLLPLLTSNIIFLFQFLPAFLTELTSALISAVINVFSLIFSYRFYILFIQKA